jgi:hypothetical protein
MFAEGLNMRQYYDEIRHYQSTIVNRTKWLLMRIIYKGGHAKETEIEESPLK